MTWVDTIVGGLLVKESRVDAKFGSEDLRYFEWLSWGVGGIIPELLGPLLFIGKLGWSSNIVFYILAVNAGFMIYLAILIPEYDSESQRQRTRSVNELDMTMRTDK